ncbi:MAG: hypothetical protein NTY35_09560 [Planctomycetota bacterium]|nr:hypothetical protein [Planctomycetota bacterium]
MNDLLLHLVLFVVIGAGIVALAAFYSEPDDAKALRVLPRRFGVFALGCAILAVLLIVAEHTVASVH